MAAMDNRLNQQHAQRQSDQDDFEAACLPYIQAVKAHYPTLDELLQEVESQNIRSRKRNATLATIAVLAIGFTSAWVINPVLSSDAFATTYAQRMVRTLPDGSVITLNSNTKVTAQLRLRSRELSLSQGEASFNVAHGMRPFYVQVNQVGIHDIGTIFNVRLTGQNVLTTVQEGLVEIKAGNAIALLPAGKSLLVAGNHVGQPYLADSEAITAWQSGRIIFDKTTLGVAMADIMRYRQAPITFLDKQSAQLRMTGVYAIQDIEPLLDSLPTMFPVKVVRTANGEIRISKK